MCFGSRRNPGVADKGVRGWRARGAHGSTGYVAGLAAFLSRVWGVGRRWLKDGAWGGRQAMGCMPGPEVPGRGCFGQVRMVI